MNKRRRKKQRKKKSDPKQPSPPGRIENSQFQESISAAAEEQNQYNEKQTSKPVKMKFFNEKTWRYFYEGILLAAAIFTVVYAQMSSHAAIDAVKQIQNQFEIANRPFLAMAAMDVRVKVDTFMTLEYILINVGNYPVFVESVQMRIMVTDGPLDYWKSLETANVLKIGNLLTKEIPLKSNRMRMGEITIEKEVADRIDSDKMKVYWYGKIIYINQLDNKKWAYKFVYRIVNPLKDSGETTTESIYSANDSIPSHRLVPSPR